jgi:hypothetical protein
MGHLWCIIHSRFLPLLVRMLLDLFSRIIALVFPLVTCRWLVLNCVEKVFTIGPRLSLRGALYYGKILL